MDILAPGDVRGEFDRLLGTAGSHRQTVRWPYLSAPTAPIDERDIAAVGVRALTESGHDGMEYVLTGPQSLTQREQILTIGDVIGRTLTVEELSREEARQAWSATMPVAVADMLMDAWAAAMG